MIDITKYSENGLNNIKSVNLLTDDNLKIIESLQTQLQDTFNKRQIYRTDTEARYSVLTDMKFPTPASKYWQSVREQNVHFTNLMYESCEYEEVQGEIELLEAEVEKLDNSKISMAVKKIKNANIKKQQFKLLDMKRTSQDRVREIQQWEVLKNEQVQKDPEFDTTNANTHQFESFSQRFENELQVSKESGDSAMYKASISQLTTIKNKKKEQKALGYE